MPGCYEDLELADLIVLVGSNTAWCHPVLFQRIVRAQASSGPSCSSSSSIRAAPPTCEIADLHLPIARRHRRAAVQRPAGVSAPSTAHVDSAFVDAHTTGLRRGARSRARRLGDAAVGASEPAASTRRGCTSFYRAVRAPPRRVVTAFSQGVNQSSAGTDKVNAIINCHLLTGRIGKPGHGAVLADRPAQCDGRARSRRPRQHARRAHGSRRRRAPRGACRRSGTARALPTAPGLKAVELFERDRTPAGSRPCGSWRPIRVVSLPDADRVRAALERCELVVVSDCVRGHGHDRARHVLLPAPPGARRTAPSPTPSGASRGSAPSCRRPAKRAPDWWIVCEVARRMGFAEGSTIATPREIFDEHARAVGSAARTTAARAFDIGGARGPVSGAEYDALRAGAVADARRATAPDGRAVRRRPLLHADGKARFVPTARARPAHATDERVTRSC